MYDPACGSGSLLLKAVKVLGPEGVRVGFFGQEINITTYNLCRINMFLHDIGYDKFDIACEDTLTNPQHWDDEPFELIVSNPPYSIKWAGTRTPPSSTTRGLPRRGCWPQEQGGPGVHSCTAWPGWRPTARRPSSVSPGCSTGVAPRKRSASIWWDNNFIDCIIQLPSNLFFRTSIATCIMVLKKNKTDSKTLFIDATKECIKVTNNNKLTPDNIARIVDTFAAGGRKPICPTWPAWRRSPGRSTPFGFHLCGGRGHPGED